MAKESAAAKTRAAKIGKAYQLLPVVGPSAGVDLRTSPTLLAPTRARALVNFALSEPGALVVRPGYTAFSTATLGTGRIQGAARVYLNTATPVAASTVFTLVGWSGGIYNQTDSGGWVSTTPSLSGLSTSAELCFVSDRDHVAVFDGVSTAIRKSTNGSSWTRFGIAPGTAPTVSTVTGSGNVSSGEYEVSYTYKDRDLAYESNGATGSTISLSESTRTLNVVIPNSTDAQVDAIVVYARKVSAGETVLRKVSSLAQSAGVSSTLAITSTTWTSNDEIPTDHTLPPVLAFGVVWKNRWWARSGSVTNRLHFTQLFQPQSWPATYYIDIPFERGDEIKALVPLGDTLLVLGTTKIFLILGQTSLDFEVRPTIASQDGAFGFRACAAIENGVVHASASGVWIFDGTSDRLLSFDLEPGWRDLVENASAAALGRIAVTYHQRAKELRISVPRRYPSGTDGEWVLDLNRTRTSQTPAWTATDRTIGGYVPWDGPESDAGNRGRLLTWHTTTGRLYEEATGTDADGGDLRAEYEGPGLTLGPYHGRWVDVRGDIEPVDGLLAIEPLVDGFSLGSQTVPMDPGGAEYGTAEYGVDDYGGGVSRRQFVQMLPLNAEGHTFVLKVVYQGQDRFRLFSYHTGLTPESAPRGFAD